MRYQVQLGQDLGRRDGFGGGREGGGRAGVRGQEVRLLFQCRRGGSSGQPEGAQGSH